MRHRSLLLAALAASPLAPRPAAAQAPRALSAADYARAERLGYNTTPWWWMR
jgi:hypothetical protein